VWYEKTRKECETGKLQILSLIEEQHPDRCRLFRQWKRLDGPALVDSLNLLGVSAVPLAFFVDEHGVVRDSKASPESLSRFLEREYDAPLSEPARHLEPPDEPPDSKALATIAQTSTGGSAGAKASLDLGDALFLAGRQEDLAPAVAAYEKAVAFGGPPETRFRLGVALRRRYESAARQDGDFRRALEAWTDALALQPNQYIWRRRIEQYGPRLEKPYAFYDWVREAREEITSRGEKPVELLVDPKGAEIARPEKTIGILNVQEKEPDPDGKIARDVDRLIRIETALAPAFVRPGKAARIHITLRPDPGKATHWNNETPQGLTVWVRAPDGLEIDKRSFSPPDPKEPETTEAREAEFDVRIAAVAKPAKISIPAYVLYHVCERKGGTCRYLRQDFDVVIDSRD
jgi:tetratricopeptide (TPR) repeat protein